MPFIRCSVIIPNRGGQPEDATTNTFHVNLSVTGMQGSGPATIAAALIAFYTATPPGQAAQIKGYMSTVHDFPNARLKMVDLDGPKPQYPFYDQPLDLGVHRTGDSLPNELAVVASFQAAPVAGIPRASLRNRIYIGPMNTAAMAQATAGPGVATPVTTVIVDAMRALWDALDGVGGPDEPVWAINSKRRAIGTQGRPVVGGWCDNAWDTQRRRGVRATAKYGDSSFVLAGQQAYALAS